MLEQYRRDYAEFNAAIMREYYLFGSGQKARLDLAPLYDRYGDLFARDTIHKLKRQLDETSAHFETERASLARLLQFAVHEFLDAAAKELTEEINAHEAAATIELAGRTMTYQEVVVATATERDRATRLRLDGKRLAVIAAWGRASGYSTRRGRIRTISRSG